MNYYYIARACVAYGLIKCSERDVNKSRFIETVVACVIHKFVILRKPLRCGISVVWVWRLGT